MVENGKISHWLNSENYECLTRCIETFLVLRIWALINALHLLFSFHLRLCTPIMTDDRIRTHTCLKKISETRMTASVLKQDPNR